MQNLRDRVEAYMKQTGVAASLFGRIAASDPKLVFDLRRGRTPGGPMLKRIEALLGKLITPEEAREFFRNKIGSQIGEVRC